jgi:hypothetical protein
MLGQVWCSWDPGLDHEFVSSACREEALGRGACVICRTLRLLADFALPLTSCTDSTVGGHNERAVYSIVMCHNARLDMRENMVKLTEELSLERAAFPVSLSCGRRNSSRHAVVIMHAHMHAHARAHRPCQLFCTARPHPVWVYDYLAHGKALDLADVQHQLPAVSCCCLEAKVIRAAQLSMPPKG